MKTLAIATICITLLISCKKTDVKVDDAKYAIGVIQQYYSYSSPPSIEFSFSSNNNMYYITYGDGHNGWGIPSKGNYSIGQKFMVQYDSINPNTAKILLIYPVTDSNQYQADLVLFKTNPPQ